MKIGDKVKFKFDHLFQVITFFAPVKFISDSAVIFSVPDSIKSLPWYPIKKSDGKSYDGLMIPKQKVREALEKNAALRLN